MATRPGFPSPVVRANLLDRGQGVEPVDQTAEGAERAKCRPAVAHWRTAHGQQRQRDQKQAIPRIPRSFHELVRQQR